jgi:hypothetical protein
MNYMKRFTNYLTALALGALALFAFSCDNNDEIKVDPNAEFDVVLKVKEDSSENVNKDYAVTSSTGSTILAKVQFQTTSGISMKRLYITANSLGSGDVVFEPTENVDLKGDGALDLTGKDDKNFEYQFELPVPDSLKSGNGTLVYSFWTTTGNGDFRDPSKRIAIGPATITLNFGNGTDPNAQVKEYNNLKLSAPAADGTSETFVSLFNGQVYAIKPPVTNPTQADFDEYISFWDFGYINKQSGGPTLHSTATYPEVVFAANFPAFNSTTEEKNHTYFRTSSKTVAEFDAISVASDLSFITKPTDEFVSNLAADTIIEFVDKYGKKGMIKVLEAVPGNSPGINYVRISIKVQP